ncbi:hypothetical protein ACFTWF_43575 [Rhodococcus sp. NPDC056960]|uniref:hypothetical protein n=1 Tax=Rhodococcus sp. NPDC056960 TaxID=3345982 RepID=UPI003630ACBD
MFRHTAIRAGLMFAAVAISVTGAAGVATAMPTTSGSGIAHVSPSDRDTRDRDRAERFDDNPNPMFCEGKAVIANSQCSTLPY